MNVQPSAARGAIRLDENPLWADLPFVESDQAVVEITYGCPSAQMAFLELVEEALTDA